MSKILPWLTPAVIWIGSTAIGALPLTLALLQPNIWSLIGGAVLFPLLFIPTFVTLAGLMSRLAQARIIPGRFPREAFQRIHGWRRVYAICWAQVFHFKPLYAISLAVPAFRRYMLRLFGYKGPSTAFVLHANTWVRDLPVLHIGQDAHLARRATMGTNICMSDDTILVDRIRVRDKGLVGHHAVLAPGCTVESGAELGTRVTVGIRTWIGPGVLVQPSSLIHHGCRLEEGCEIGSGSYIGSRARIGKGIKVPAGAHIAEGAVIINQGDMDRYHSSETQTLQDFAASLQSMD